MTDRRADIPPAQPRTSYEDLDVLQDANGLIARISRRTKTGEITFAIFKTFPRDGEMQQTSFVPHTMGPAYIAMTQTALTRCQEIANDYETKRRAVAEGVGDGASNKTRGRR